MYLGLPPRWAIASHSTSSIWEASSFPSPRRALGDCVPEGDAFLEQGMVTSMLSLEVPGRFLTHKCHPVMFAICLKCQHHRDVASSETFGFFFPL